MSQNSETDGSKVLGTIDLNNLAHNHSFNGSNGDRISLNRRRSSIRKFSEVAFERRSSRRVSWAQTFQYKELLSDGTTVLTSQELNKFGPVENVEANESNKNRKEFNTQYPLTGSQTNEENNIEFNEEENIQQIKNKFGQQHLPKVLSKYYNPNGDVKDYETVINTALNKYGIEIDSTNPTNNLTKLFDLFKKENPSQEQNLTAFLKYFNLGEHVQQSNSAKKLNNDQKSKNSLNYTTIESDEMDTTERFRFNSTKISDDHSSLDLLMIDQSPIKISDLLDINVEYEQSPMEEIMNTIHDTTFMKISSDDDKHELNSESKNVNQICYLGEMDQPVQEENHDMSLDLSMEITPMMKAKISKECPIQISIDVDFSSDDSDTLKLDMSIPKNDAGDFLKNLQQENQNLGSISDESIKLDSPTNNMATSLAVEDSKNTSTSIYKNDAGDFLKNFQQENLNPESIQLDAPTNGMAISLIVEDSKNTCTSIYKNDAGDFLKNLQQENQNFESTKLDIPTSVVMSLVEDSKNTCMSIGKNVAGGFPKNLQEENQNLESIKLDSPTNSMAISLAVEDSKNTCTSIPKNDAGDFLKNLQQENQNFESTKLDIPTSSVAMSLVEDSKNTCMSISKNDPRSFLKNLQENQNLDLTSTIVKEENDSKSIRDPKSFSIFVEKNTKAIKSNITNNENNVNFTSEIGQSIIESNNENFSTNFDDNKSMESISTNYKEDDLNCMKNQQGLISIFVDKSNKDISLPNININSTVEKTKIDSDVLPDRDVSMIIDDENEIIEEIDKSNNVEMLFKSFPEIPNISINLDNSGDQQEFIKRKKEDKNPNMSVKIPKFDLIIEETPMIVESKDQMIDSEISTALKANITPPKTNSNTLMFASNRKIQMLLDNSYNINNEHQNKSVTMPVSLTPAQVLIPKINFLQNNSELTKFEDKECRGPTADDSMISFFNTNSTKNCIRKSLGLTLRDRLLEKINQQQENEHKNIYNFKFEANDVKSPKERIMKEKDKNTEQTEKENFSVSIEFIRENQSVDQTERVLSPIQMEHSLVSMLSLENEDDSKSIEKEPEDEVSNLSENQTFNNSTLNMTANFTLWINDCAHFHDPIQVLDYSVCSKLLDPFDEKKISSDLTMFNFIKNLDFYQLNVRIQSISHDLLVLRYLFSTLELRIHFGSVIKPMFNRFNGDYLTSESREIVAMDLVSLINSNEPLPQNVMKGREDEPLYNGDWFILPFGEEDRPLLHLAHDYVLEHFEEKRNFFDKTYRDTTKLEELIKEMSILVTPAKKLATELRILMAREIMRIIPKNQVPEGRFGISVEILGLVLNTSFELYITFDHLKYPDEVIHPNIIVPDEYRHLYPLEEFSAALKMIKPCSYNYITNLIRGAKCFVLALRKVMKQNKLHQIQTELIRMNHFELQRS